MTNLIRIVAAIVDTKKATLYKEDGTTIVIPQGDARLRPLLEKITPLLASQRYADVGLTTEDNSYKEFEEKSGGAVRFFRIAKSKLAGIFGTKKEEVEPAIVGQFGTPVKDMAAVEEIIKHAVPVTSSDFDEKNVAQQRPTEVAGNTPNDATNNGKDTHFDKSQETIVAVTQKGNVVAGIERIKSQVKAASGKDANPKGLTRFLERIGAVSADRKHTAEDLLRFMERGDLPIADDGCIIIYKRLNRRKTAHGDYVDCHSGNVHQKVGSYVHMDVSLVDHNRRNECSNGLHVARRGYIKSFSGDVCVLAKVRPEDVIAVPDYDANKMRVCGYHIIAELTAAQFQAVEANRGIDNATGGAELLAQAMSGDHIGIIQRVKINGHQGGNLEVTDIEPTGPVEYSAEPATSVDKSVEDVTAEVQAKTTAPAQAPVDKSKEPKKRVIKSKKAAKAKRKVAVKKAVAKAVIAKQAKSLEAAGVVRSDQAVDPKDLQKLKEGTAKSLTPDAKGLVTQTDVVKALWDSALAGDRAKTQELLDFKKKAKKGWTVWGLPENAGDILKALLVS